MSSPVETENDIYTENEQREDTTKADAADGGILGAVGGGIVGALAGGPLGAVIGAVVGGGASALAVDVIDQHDQKNAIYHTERTSGYDSGRERWESRGDTLPGSLNPNDEALLFEQVNVVVLSPVEHEDQVRLRAYELWETRGHRDGFAEEDWYDAERELSVVPYAFEGVDDFNDTEEVEDVVGYSS